MRITDQSMKEVILPSTKNVNTADVAPQRIEKPTLKTANTQPIENEKVELPISEENAEKLQEAVDMMNEMLELHKNSSRFHYHEGLDRYYVTVVDSETDEVVKEIPPKRLLDAFYEMQKMVGMIVDEKI